jgi:hypothetical protein
MISAPFISSPSAEKRVIISLIRKELIGRRAYSDSIYGRKTNRGLEHGLHTLSVISSSSSSSTSSPRYEVREVSSSELEKMAFEISTC